MVWSPIDVALELIENGINGRGNVAIGVAVCAAESHFDDQITLDNTKLNPPGKGIDRGLFQINSFWHPEVTDEMAFDGKTNVREAVRIFRENSSTWNPWAAFKNGAYDDHMEMGRVAAEAAKRINVLAKANAALTDANANLEKTAADLRAAVASRDAAMSELQVKLADLSLEADSLRALKTRFDAWVQSIVTGAQVSGSES